MRQLHSECDEPSIHLKWDKVRDAASDAILRAPSIHAEVIETTLETEINQTSFPRPASQGHIRKHLTFKTYDHPEKWRIGIHHQQKCVQTTN